MNERPHGSQDAAAAIEAQRGRARVDAAEAIAQVKAFLDERGTLVDVRGLSEAELDALRKPVVRYAVALRVLQDSAESVILKVRRLMEDGARPELGGARRELVNEAVTWAIKAYFNAKPLT